MLGHNMSYYEPPADEPNYIECPHCKDMFYEVEETCFYTGYRDDKIFCSEYCRDRWNEANKHDYEDEK